MSSKLDKLPMTIKNFLQCKQNSSHEIHNNNNQIQWDSSLSLRRFSIPSSVYTVFKRYFERIQDGNWKQSWWWTPNGYSYTHSFTATITINRNNRRRWHRPSFFIWTMSDDISKLRTERRIVCSMHVVGDESQKCWH